ncbi:hypothetical protein [Dechloromonas denitrificans]|uniref:hypothetical protein n=1 Tax=Dechloromonas denitrificans TaxID=281362 RepID=UPI001CF8F23B|nr:hypothetical protein [Dechloromonas denitrificans]UCV03885.1 hypothetical protein KI611_00990 [Dechloromonas denitrificans]
MKKSVVYSFVALVVCIGAFFAGRQIGASGTERQHLLRDSYLAVINASAAYSYQADIAQAIAGGKNAQALCLINVQASAQVNTVRACLETLSCAQMVEPEIMKIAPELLGHGELRIRYYKEGELCTP